MKTLRFINPMPPYVVDDVATFDDNIASKIIEKGYANEINIKETNVSKGDKNATDNKGES